MPATNNGRQRSSRLDIPSLVNANNGSQPARRSDLRRDYVGLDATRSVELRAVTSSATPATNSLGIFVTPRDIASTLASKILAGSGYYTHVAKNVQEWPKSCG